MAAFALRHLAIFFVFVVDAHVHVATVRDDLLEDSGTVDVNVASPAGAHSSAVHSALRSAGSHHHSLAAAARLLPAAAGGAVVGVAGGGGRRLLVSDALKDDGNGGGGGHGGGGGGGGVDMRDVDLEVVDAAELAAAVDPEVEAQHEAEMAAQRQKVAALNEQIEYLSKHVVLCPAETAFVSSANECVPLCEKSAAAGPACRECGEGDARGVCGTCHPG